jgi:hypothetical protein
VQWRRKMWRKIQRCMRISHYWIHIYLWGESQEWKQYYNIEPLIQKYDNIYSIAGSYMGAIW